MFEHGDLEELLEDRTREDLLARLMHQQDRTRSTFLEPPLALGRCRIDALGTCGSCQSSNPERERRYARISRGRKFLCAGPYRVPGRLDRFLAVHGWIVGNRYPVAFVDVCLKLGVVDVPLDIQCAGIKVDFTVRADL